MILNKNTNYDDPYSSESESESEYEDSSDSITLLFYFLIESRAGFR